MHGEQTRGRRRPQHALARGHRTRHAGAVGVRLLRCASHRAEALRRHPDEIGMGEIDLRIDHRDRDVGASDHAVDVQHLELLEDVLRGVALLLGRIAPRRRRLLGAGLVEVVDVLRLRHRDHLHCRQRADDLSGGAAVVDVQAHRGRAEDREIFRRQDAHPEVRHRSAQALDADVGADLHHHLVGLQARLVRWRDVDDALVDAGRQKRIARRGSSAGRSPGRLPRQPDAALGRAHDRRSVERGELERAGEVEDHLRLLRRQ